MGRFTKQIRRAKNGKFASTSRSRVVAGRLYSFKGIPVRAGHLEGGRRFISVHKTLFGFAFDQELEKIDKSKVNHYLSNTH